MGGERPIGQVKPVNASVMGDDREFNCWYDGELHTPHRLELTDARNEHGCLTALVRVELTVVDPAGGACHEDVLGSQGRPELAEGAAQP